MEHDEGFSFGMGVFETMLVRDGRCILFGKHMERLRNGMEVLGMDRGFDPSPILDIIMDGHLDGRVLKVEVSRRNNIISDREMTYTEEDHEKGFRLVTSEVLRNETSPLTYIKSLNHADCIMEKRKAKSEGFDEPVFLNTKGFITEGATSNIFLTDGDEIVTPSVDSGILPGTVRSFIIENMDVRECHLEPGDIADYTGCFLTNSLFGVMNVSSFDDITFSDRRTSDDVRRFYEDAVENGI